ncbi:hypothetical protein [Erwinia sorbitola]|uniref:Uncharacterized protein n=1 Tax=Erwinia sorbitola TaxID=2681984 RepID=A0ABW9RGR7_9GAMM|nr:hypothetical protein [Erwinia sorbitola]MTD29419.1 hypothetical protein [Erwinia sorbitola]
MLTTIDRSRLDFFTLLSLEINQLSVIIQSDIITDVKLKSICSSVSIDIINQSVWLRFEIQDQGVQWDGVFENDIINVKIEGDMVFITCSVYSDYGLDNIISYCSRVDEFNDGLFKELYPILLSCLREHISFYM